MSAVMAQELRNPLASAKGHAQLLVGLLEVERPRDKAGYVVSELIRLESLTNDLLSFVQSGRINVISVDLNAFIQTVTKQMTAASF